MFSSSESRKKRGLERRKFIRVDNFGPIQYRKIGHVVGGRKITKDISEGGIKFLADEFIPISALLKVEITLEKSLKPVTAIVKVAWVRKLPLQDGYEVGAAFEGMDKNVVTYINHYITKLAEK